MIFTFEPISKRFISKSALICPIPEHFSKASKIRSPFANMEETLSEIAAMINLSCSRITASLLRVHVQKMPSRVNGQVRPNLGNCHIFLHYADPFSLATTLFMTDICRISGHLSLDLLVASPYT